MKPYRELEHTADLGLEINGSTIDELFTNGVKGLFYLISPNLIVAEELKTFPEKPHFEIVELDAFTQEELLIHWLNEFIYNFFVKNVFPKTIKIISLTEKNIRAEVEYSKYSKSIEISHEVKVATYHNICIKRFDSKYSAKVIFDV